ncbi:DEHA2B00330p [Debaryomyces hansenii CBS767]|uniref:DEHA2B00330p n=1 Tax=Debaryomyces hansenii (strain ATCC 36239 / CBS 767 / BCRC 21394 / JCM 1990 / NBRC 0083 / IGC 2968) TaxID=284592 RepID=Q6BXT8_DEBHA|nr:DEHA2B00330p [Debaryomyces hansenii CBS767]CAG84963.1 DEHA2B00330p [Debaryomyces hansenii CBS767]|eukprot:XP_456981.1 DEHA2B00330p [Debaryomyces hansenii CBS767]
MIEILQADIMERKQYANIFGDSDTSALVFHFLPFNGGGGRIIVKLIARKPTLGFSTFSCPLTVVFFIFSLFLF